MIICRAVGWWKRLEPGFRYCLGILLALRLGLSAWGIVVTLMLPPLNLDGNILPLYHGVTPVMEGLEGLLLGVWQRWDAIWYLMIAEQGYRAGNEATVFLPLYPIAMRLLAPAMGGNLLLSGILISTVSTFCAFLALYRLTELEFGTTEARGAVLHLAVFPTAYFLMAPYTEAMFLALVVGSFLMAAQNRWSWAAVLAAAGALTRLSGVLLVIPLTVELLMQSARSQSAGRQSLPVRQLATLGLIPAATGGYIVYLIFIVGDRVLWGHLGGDVWRLRFAAPWDGVIGNWLAVTSGQLSYGEALPTVLDLAASVLFIGLAIAAFRWMRPCYGLYMAAMLVTALIKVTDNGLLQSMTRYVLPLFPGFMLIAIAARPPWLRRLVTYPSISLLGFLTAVFMRWGWTG